MHTTALFTRGDAGSVLQLALSVGVPLLVAAFAFRTPSTADIERWAATRRLRLTASNGRLVATYLGRTRRLRTLGGAAGLVFAMVPGSLYNLVDPASRLGRALVGIATSGWGWAAVVGGYLLGALVAEFSLSRPGDAGRRRAVLLPRDVDQYATPWARVGLRVVAAAPPATIVLFLLLSPEADSVVRHAALAALGIGIFVFVEWLQRVIVRRSQNAVDADILAADDAIRSSSVHACLGAGLMLMTLLGTVLTEIGGAGDGDPVGWLLFLGILLTFGAIVVWLGLGTAYARAVRRSGNTSPST